jgi:hypothetical protein
MDLVAGTTTIDGDLISLAIYGEIAAWLLAARRRDQLSEGTIHEFKVRVDFAVDGETRGGTTTQTHNLAASSRLACAEGIFVGESRKRELWTRMGASDEPWLVQDV